MKAILRLLAVCLVVGGALSLALAEDIKWTNYSSKESKFSADFPSKDVKVLKKKTGTHHQAGIPGTDTLFLVAVSKMPKAPGSPEADLAELKRVRDAVVAAQKATLGESRDLVVQGHQTHEFTMKVPTAGTTIPMHCRYVIVKDRFYQQVTGGPANRDLSKESEHFFKSLQLTVE